MTDMDPPVQAVATQYEQCRHSIQKLRCRTYRNGTTHFAMQCSICGNEARRLRKNELTDADRQSATPWDDEIQGRYWERRSRTHELQRESRLSLMREHHTAYLQSAEWSRRRSNRMQFDRHQCQARLDGCLMQATEVHHLSYRFHGNEPMFDLVSLCRPCHKQVSEMEGRVRQGEAA